MSCSSLTGGIAKDCDKNLGGIRKLWLILLDDIASITHSSPNNDITAITTDGGKDFYEFEFNRNTSNFTEVTANDPATGSSVVTQTLTLVLNKREQTKRDKLVTLGAFRDLVAIVLDYNGEYTVLGEYNGLILTENNSETGTAKTDRNGYTITFVGEEPEEACFTNASVVNGIIA